MKIIKKIVVLVFALLFFGVVTVYAQGISIVYSNNSASINWNSLSISSDDGSFSAVTDPGYFYSKSRAYTTEAYWSTAPMPSSSYDIDRKVDDAVTKVSSTTGTAPNYASSAGKTTVSAISAVAVAEVASGGAFAADGLAQRGQVYEITQSGKFDFSIPYTLSQELNPLDGDAFGYVRAWAQLRRSNGVEYVDIQKVVMALTPSSGSLCFSYQGTVGQYILFEAGVDACSSVQKAVVPIPGAVWLLGSGLLGLVGIRRFRN